MPPAVSAITLIFAIALIAAGVCGIWLYRKLGTSQPTVRLIATCLPVLILVTLFEFLVLFVSAFTVPTWMANRLTPAFALVHGQSLYNGPSEGPVIGMIYGPMMAVAYLPATVASSPSAAFAIGVLLSIAFYFAPIAWLHKGLRTNDTQSLLISGLGFICFCLISFKSSSIWVAFEAHADAPALGLVAASCAVLYVNRHHTHLVILASALLAILACWTKQPAGFLIPAILVFVACVDGSVALRRYMMWLGLWGLLVSGGLLLLFGWREVAFNMFTVPSGHFVEGGSGGSIALWSMLPAASGRYKQIVSDTAPALIAIVFSLLATATQFGLRDLGAWMRENRWALFLMVGLAGLPAALIGSLKPGGDTNPLAYASYGLTAAATLALVEISLRPGKDGPQPAPSFARFLLLALTITSAASYFPPGFRKLAEGLPYLSDNSENQVYAFARKHPGEVYFPWHPLAVLMAEGKLYHFSYGLFDRELAGYPVTQEHFRGHIPPRTRFVAISRSVNREEEYVSRYLPEFSRAVHLDDLPGWTLYAREHDELSPATGSSR